jgi:hypothetical protein
VWKRHPPRRLIGLGTSPFRSAANERRHRSVRTTALADFSFRTIPIQMSNSQGKSAGQQPRKPRGCTISRRLASEGVPQRASSKSRGRREGRVLAATHGPPAAKNAGGRYHRLSQTSGLPCAMFYGFLRALLGDHGLVATVAGGISSADLAPASERRDHTTSPSASASFVRAKPRADAFTSIASRTHVS